MDNERDIALVQAGIDACVEYWWHDNAGPNLDAAAIAATVPEQFARSAPAVTSEEAVSIRSQYNACCNRDACRRMLDGAAAPAGSGEAVGDERSAFELSYAQEWRSVSQNAAQYPIEHLCNELKEMRQGDKYGEGQDYLNFKWAGWQARALLAVAQQPAPDGEAVAHMRQSSLDALAQHRKNSSMGSYALLASAIPHPDLVALYTRPASPPVNLLVEALKKSMRKWFYEEFEDSLLERMEKAGFIASAEGYSTSMLVSLEVEIEAALAAAGKE